MRILFRIAIVLLLTVGARADSFNFTFSSRDFDLSGTLSGNLLSPGVYQINRMTGAFIPGKEPPLNEVDLLPPGEFTQAHSDNLLFTNEPYVDSFGINFWSGSAVIYALTHDGDEYALLTCRDSSCSSLTRIPGDLEVSSTIPEPPSMLLVVSGLTLLGVQIRRVVSNRFA